MGLTVDKLDNKMNVYDYLQHYKEDDGKECVVFPITRAKNVIGIPKMSNKIEDLKGCSFGILAIDEISIDENLLNRVIGAPVF